MRDLDFIYYCIEIDSRKRILIVKIQTYMRIYLYPSSIADTSSSSVYPAPVVMALLFLITSKNSICLAFPFHFQYHYYPHHHRRHCCCDENFYFEFLPYLINVQVTVRDLFSRSSTRGWLIMRRVACLLA